LRVLEGIARKVLLTAAYNGQRLTLAPHSLFARRGELYTSALNLTKKWRTAEDRKLGYFKVSGLAGVELTEQPFESLPGAEAMLAKADDELVLTVS
jgi:hypothetical protein